MNYKGYKIVRAGYIFNENKNGYIYKMDSGTDFIDTVIKDKTPRNKIMKIINDRLKYLDKQRD